MSPSSSTSSLSRNDCSVNAANINVIQSLFALYGSSSPPQVESLVSIETQQQQQTQTSSPPQLLTALERLEGSATPPLHATVSTAFVQPQMDTKDIKNNNNHQTNLSNGEKKKKELISRTVCLSPVKDERLQKRKRTASTEDKRTKKKKAAAESDDESTSDDKKLSGRWTSIEHNKFLEGLKKFGKDWRNIASHIGTRNYVQTRTHAQKYFKKIAKLRQGLGEEIPFEFMSTANNGKQWQFLDEDMLQKKSTEAINHGPTFTMPQAFEPAYQAMVAHPGGYPFFPLQVMTPYYGMAPIDPSMFQFLTPNMNNVTTILSKPDGVHRS